MGQGLCVDSPFSSPRNFCCRKSFSPRKDVDSRAGQAVFSLCILPGAPLCVHVPLPQELPKLPISLCHSEGLS